MIEKPEISRLAEKLWGVLAGIGWDTPRQTCEEMAAIAILTVRRRKNRKPPIRRRNTRKKSKRRGR